MLFLYGFLISLSVFLFNLCLLALKVPFHYALQMIVGGLVLIGVFGFLGMNGIFGYLSAVTLIVIVYLYYCWKFIKYRDMNILKYARFVMSKTDYNNLLGQLDLEYLIDED
jgi:acyl-[acyl carrier protein]--UDP-N-acetylglucosamine O-acyltransferase